MTEDQLIKKKKEVDVAKISVSELNGQKTALMNQLKTDWNCSTLEKAIEKGKKMSTEVENLTKQIEENIEELEKMY